MKAVLEKLVERHGTYGVDWMGFTLTKKNPLTYHHIQKDSEKGKKTLDNGAPLSKNAHRFLNCLERVKPDLYIEWNDLFREINATASPPTVEHKRKIKTLRQKGENLENFYLKNSLILTSNTILILYKS